jgi:hypothetical protein
LLLGEVSRQILTYVPRRSLSIGFIAQSTNRKLLDFETKTKKPSW